LRSTRAGRAVNSIIELNPDALAMARQADVQRRRGHVLGPLHGIPVLLKANIDTADRMQTTAGSLALAGVAATRDSTVAALLRAGGAVILGKTNLSEWGEFPLELREQRLVPASADRLTIPTASPQSVWIELGIGGRRCRPTLATVSLGTETDGSIVCPANANGVVGIKPTVGLTSRAGVVPISHPMDTVGPHGRTVADCGRGAGVIQSLTFDGPLDAATGSVPLVGRGARADEYPDRLHEIPRRHGLRGARIGVTRQGVDSAPAAVVDAFDDAVAAIKAAGATVVELDGPNGAGSRSHRPMGELLVLEFDFRSDVSNYFATRSGVPMAGKTLADAIAFTLPMPTSKCPSGDRSFRASQWVGRRTGCPPAGLPGYDLQPGIGNRPAGPA